MSQFWTLGTWSLPLPAHFHGLHHDQWLWSKGKIQSCQGRVARKNLSEQPLSPPWSTISLGCYVASPIMELSPTAAPHLPPSAAQQTAAYHQLQQILLLDLIQPLCALRCFQRYYRNQFDAKRLLSSKVAEKEDKVSWKKDDSVLPQQSWIWIWMTNFFSGDVWGPELASRWLTKALLKGDYSQKIARIILRLFSDDRSSTIRPSTKSCLILLLSSTSSHSMLPAAAEPV